MKRIVLLLVFLCPTLCVAEDDLRVMFWNLENFFDYRDERAAAGEGKDDRVMSRKAFYSKCNQIAKTVLWAGGEYGMPDIIGVAEVENAFVMRQVLSSTLLRKCGYRYLHYESADRRGIDVGLYYGSRCKIASKGKTPVVTSEGDTLATRDMLWAVTTDGTAFVVCHHPSKFSGAKASAPKREAAVESLCRIADSLSSAGHRIIVMGDFNDTPTSPVFGPLETRLTNMSEPHLRKKDGTIRYNGKWELIDMFWVSGGFEDKAAMEILRPPFLMERDPRHGGVRPRRAYSGPRFTGGVSDHLPVYLVVKK
ncbi:MAG: endonuclease/exonuclease/phosphatase family protein [Bacteroidales bacterium]|nr:endonuclease/exonuclease/phosphatase family protein [Bacteroidales bacterium]